MTNEQIKQAYVIGKAAKGIIRYRGLQKQADWLDQSAKMLRYTPRGQFGSWAGARLGKLLFPSNRAGIPQQTTTMALPRNEIIQEEVTDLDDVQSNSTGFNVNRIYNEGSSPLGSNSADADSSPAIAPDSSPGTTEESSPAIAPELPPDTAAESSPAIAQELPPDNVMNNSAGNGSGSAHWYENLSPYYTPVLTGAGTGAILGALIQAARGKSILNGLLVGSGLGGAAGAGYQAIGGIEGMNKKIQDMFA